MLHIRSIIFAEYKEYIFFTPCTLELSFIKENIKFPISMTTVNIET